MPGRGFRPVQTRGKVRYAPAQRLTTLIVNGAQTTQTAYGTEWIGVLHRGEFEQVLAALGGLAAQFADSEQGAV